MRNNNGGGDPSSNEPCVNTTAPEVAETETPEDNTPESPSEPFELDVYPNPFRHQLNFEFKATKNNFVKIEILDKFGNRLTVLYEGTVSAGEQYKFDWTASGLRDHIYHYRFTSSDIGLLWKVAKEKLI